MLGADEAGKGPVLGPMVAGAVRADPEDLPETVADSKRLTAEQRETLAAEIESDPEIETATARITTERIDAPETDMNSLTVAGQVEALAGLATETDTVVVDAGDVSESRFARRVADGVVTANDWDGDRFDVTAEHGADDEYAVVAAASIVAKVERDRRMAEIDAVHDRAVGSGYPSDGTTRQFLSAYVAEHGELPDCTRRSWATAEDVLAAQEQAGFDDF